jgi:hypothetical protein
VPAELSKVDLGRLAELEVIVELGMTTFVEVGTALLEIREARLYRATHDTFEAYCRERWGMSKTHANRLTKAAEVVQDLTPIGVKSANEAQVRPLSELPKSERKEAWAEAVEASNGKPTAKAVRAVVDRKLGKAPKAEARPLETAKPTATVNGKAAADPPDVARARAAGVIPADAVVEIVEPEPAAEPLEPEPAELSDDEWLATLPLSARLTGQPARIFRRDALLYRRLEPARRTYQVIFNREAKGLARAKAGTPAGEYEGRTSFWLRLEHPKGWTRCPAVEHGGCAGTGQVELIGECPKCKGKGYGVYTR